MSDQSPPASPNRRRSSFVEFFNPRASANAAVSSSAPSGGQAPVPTSPEVPQKTRGMSVTSALGLSGTTPTQTSPFSAFAKQRRASISTSSASSSPEFKDSFNGGSAVVEEDDGTAVPGNTPISPSFGRRVSFGAQALRDVKGGANSVGGGEGFNWSEALRERSKRSPSFSSGNPFGGVANKPRVASNPVPEPPKELPKPVEPVPLKARKPDHLGERMLRGDFMMD